MHSYIMVSPVGMSISLQTPQHYRCVSMACYKMLQHFIVALISLLARLCVQVCGSVCTVCGMCFVF